MRKNTYHHIIAALILLLTLSSTAFANVAWRTYSTSVFANAKTQHKLVLIYGKSESCHWCTKMNNDTLSDSRISALISKKFIPVTIDIVTEKQLADKYHIRGTPTFVILDANQNQVTQTVGYQSVNAFRSFLESAY